MGRGGREGGGEGGSVGRGRCEVGRGGVGRGRCGEREAWGGGGVGEREV